MTDNTITITITGPVGSGKTTLAFLLEEFIYSKNGSCPGIVEASLPQTNQNKDRIDTSRVAFQLQDHKNISLAGRNFEIIVKDAPVKKQYSTGDVKWTGTETALEDM